MLNNVLISLVEMQFALALGVAVVLGLRHIVRNRFGAAPAYRLWALVPVIMVAIAIPARTISMTIPAIAPSVIAPNQAVPPVVQRYIPAVAQAEPRPTPVQPASAPVAETATAPVALAPSNNAARTEIGAATPAPLPTNSGADTKAAMALPSWVKMPSLPVLGLLVWGFGLLLTAGIFWLRQRAYERALGTLEPMNGTASTVMRSGRDDIGPALIGMRRPRIVVPSNFENTYSTEEQMLILEHENVHYKRGDAQANGLAAALVCFGWWNPLLHIALKKFRLDQELACDAAVVQRHPSLRRTYGEAMLKSQLRGSDAPLACHWLPDHPLKERIAMLTLPSPSRTQRAVGTLLVVGTAIGGGTLAWASQPPTVVSTMAPATIEPAVVTVDAAPVVDFEVNATIDPNVVIARVQDTEFEPILPQVDANGAIIDDTFDVKTVKIEDVAGILTIIPENRSNYAVTISGDYAPQIDAGSRKLMIEGNLPEHRRKCKDLTAKKVAKREDALQITIRTPMDANLYAEGILFSKVGKTNNADLGFAGCGGVKIADSDGPMELSIHGAVSGEFGDVKGPLELSVHGAADAEGGDVSGDAELSIHGAADLEMGSIDGDVEASIHGAADATLRDIGGSLEASVHGAADLSAGKVGGPIDASIHGSADVDLEEINKGLDASIHGSASLDADRTNVSYLEVNTHGSADIDLGSGYAKKVKVGVSGSADFSFDGKADYAYVKSSRSGSVYIREVDTVEISNPDPDGPIKLKTKARNYR